MTIHLKAAEVNTIKACVQSRLTLHQQRCLQPVVPVPTQTMPVQPRGKPGAYGSWADPASYTQWYARTVPSQVAASSQPWNRTKTLSPKASTLLVWPLHEQRWALCGRGLAVLWTHTGSLWITQHGTWSIWTVKHSYSSLLCEITRASCLSTFLWRNIEGLVVLIVKHTAEIIS